MREQVGNLKTRRKRVGARAQAIAVLAVSALVLLAGCGGKSGSGATQWQYAAMGDSLAVGILDTQGGYAVRYRGYTQSDTGNTVTLVNLGVNGWHSSDLLNALQNDSRFRGSVMAAQVVTWDIGGDDLLHAVSLFQSGTCGGADNQDCLRSAVASFGPNWDAIVQQILALRDKNSTILRTMDVYNPFVAQLMASGKYNTVEPYLDQVNTHIAASCAANGIPMARIHEAFNGTSGTEDPIVKGFITIDGVHPNDNGHKVIADTLRGLGYGLLK